MEYGLCSYVSIFKDLEVVYSVDMVRFRFELKKSCNQCFIKNISSDDFNGSVTNYFSSKYMSYKNIITISSGKWSVITVGLCLNDDTSDGARKGFIEFNPNKVDANMLQVVMDLLKEDCASKYDVNWLELVRWDCAIDIPFKREKCHLVKDRRSYKYILEKGSITEYLGKRSNGNFVKLYDKTKEMSLNEDLTRLEVTFDGVQMANMPQVNIDYGGLIGYPDNANPTECVLIDLLSQLDDELKSIYLSRLGRKVKQKIKDYIYTGVVLEYDIRTIGKLMMWCKKLENGIVIYSDFHVSTSLPFNENKSGDSQFSFLV